MPSYVTGREALSMVIIIDGTGPIGLGEGTVVTVSVPAELTGRHPCHSWCVDLTTPVIT